jgi:hypothetical protein
VGKIELCATPPVWLEELRVYPQLKKHPLSCLNTNVRGK